MKQKTRKGILSACFLLMMVAGCSRTEQVESTIRSVLKDPDSVKFQTVLVSKDETRACAIWSAKNSLGGYGEWQITPLRRVDSVWKIASYTITPELCNEEFYKLRDEMVVVLEKVMKSSATPDDMKKQLAAFREVDNENPTLMKETFELMKVLAKH